MGVGMALEQTGCLLSAAVILCDAGKSPTAVGVAMLAREEQGKARILFDLARQIAEGALVVSMDDVDNLVEDHLEKQRKGVLSIMLKSSGSDSVGKLLRRLMELKPETPDFEKAVTELNDLERRLRKRVPDERRLARE